MPNTNTNQHAEWDTLAKGQANGAGGLDLYACGILKLILLSWGMPTKVSVFPQVDDKKVRTGRWHMRVVTGTYTSDAGKDINIDQAPTAPQAENGASLNIE